MRFAWAVLLLLCSCGEAVAPIDRIEVIPRTFIAGGDSASQQLTVQGFSGGRSFPITEGVRWSSNNSLVATVSDTGLVTGRANGMAFITASVMQGERQLMGTSVGTFLDVGGPGAFEGVEVLCPTSLAAGLSGNCTALARYTIGARANVTGGAVWMSSDPSIVRVDQAGRVVAGSRGVAEISAVYMGRTGTARISIPD